MDTNTGITLLGEAAQQYVTYKYYELICETIVALLFVCIFGSVLYILWAAFKNDK